MATDEQPQQQHHDSSSDDNGDVSAETKQSVKAGAKVASPWLIAKAHQKVKKHGGKTSSSLKHGGAGAGGKAKKKVVLRTLLDGGEFHETTDADDHAATSPVINDYHNDESRKADDVLLHDVYVLPSSVETLVNNSFGACSVVCRPIRLKFQPNRD